MKIKNVTRQKLYNASLLYKYMILRYPDGSFISINSKITRTKRPMKLLIKNPNKKTKFISFRSCSFMEYITHKIPFI